MHVFGANLNFYMSKDVVWMLSTVQFLVENTHRSLIASVWNLERPRILASRCNETMHPRISYAVGWVFASCPEVHLRSANAGNEQQMDEQRVRTISEAYISA